MHITPVQSAQGFFVLDTLASQIGAFFVVMTCGFALLKGDDTERNAGVLISVLWLASLLAQLDSSLFNFQIWMFGIDVVMLAILIALVWKSDKQWIVWASGFQALVVMSHIVPYINPNLPALSAFIVINMAGYGVLGCLAIGTFWAWQDRVAEKLSLGSTQ
mgnify:CR=1 FL=1